MLRRIAFISAVVLLAVLAVLFTALNQQRFDVDLLIARFAVSSGLALLIAFAAGLLAGALWRSNWIARLLAERGRLRNALRLAEARRPSAADTASRCWLTACSSFWLTLVARSPLGWGATVRLRASTAGGAGRRRRAALPRRRALPARRQAGPRARGLPRPRGTRRRDGRHALRAGQPVSPARRGGPRHPRAPAHRRPRRSRPAAPRRGAHRARPRLLPCRPVRPCREALPAAGGQRPRAGRRARIPGAHPRAAARLGAGGGDARTAARRRACRSSRARSRTTTAKWPRRRSRSATSTPRASTCAARDGSRRTSAAARSSAATSRACGAIRSCAVQLYRGVVRHDFHLLALVLPQARRGGAPGRRCASRSTNPCANCCATASATAPRSRMPRS